MCALPAFHWKLQKSHKCDNSNPISATNRAHTMEVILISPLAPSDLIAHAAGAVPTQTPNQAQTKQIV